MLQGKVPLYCLDFFCMSYNPALNALNLNSHWEEARCWRNTVTSVYLKCAFRMF